MRRTGEACDDIARISRAVYPWVDVYRLVRGGNNAIRVEVGVREKAVVQGCHDSDDSWHLIVDTAARRLLLRVWKQFMPRRPDDRVATVRCGDR